MIHCAPAEGGSNETEREAHERHYAAGRFVRVAWERQIAHGVLEDCGLVLDDKVACSSTIECVADVTSLFELDAAGHRAADGDLALRGNAHGGKASCVPALVTPKTNRRRTAVRPRRPPRPPAPAA